MKVLSERDIETIKDAWSIEFKYSVGNWAIVNGTYFPGDFFTHIHVKDPKVRKLKRPYDEYRLIGVDADRCRECGQFAPEILRLLNMAL